MLVRAAHLGGRPTRVYPAGFRECKVQRGRASPRPGYADIPQPGRSHVPWRSRDRRQRVLARTVRERGPSRRETLSRAATA
jgi:hypothetical protein